MVIMGGSAPSTIPPLSPYIVRFSYSISHLTAPLAEWTAKKYRRAYVAVNDFAPGHETEAVFENVFKGEGREIVGKVRIPLSTHDYTPFMQRVRDAKPDVLFMFVIGGPHMTNMLKAASELKFDKAGIALVSTTDPGDANEKLPQSAVGMLSGYFYTPSADRPANKAFVAAYRKEYGDKHSPNPDWVAVTAYDAMDGIYYAIREQKGQINPDRSMELLRNYKNPNSPRGPISINPQTRDIVQNIYLREVRKVGDDVINVELEPVGIAVRN
jgi:branched-chain amino acid transport system substrate-binding protein